MEHVQREAALICIGDICHTSSENLRSKLGWESLKLRRCEYRLHLCHRMTFDNFLQYLKELLQRTVETSQPYNHWNIKDIRPGFSRLESYRKHFLSKTRNLNKLSIVIKTTEKYKLFQTKLRKTLYIRTCKKLHDHGFGTSAKNLVKLRMDLIHSINISPCWELRIVLMLDVQHTSASSRLSYITCLSLSGLLTNVLCFSLNYLE